MLYKKFSLIVATLGRDQTVAELLDSFVALEYPKDKIEIIIVDQNEKSILEPILEKYIGLLNIIHIKSEMLGLSRNRNIGISKSSGDIIAFPDDDCVYPPNTLTFVNEKVNRERIDFILGSIWDKDKNIMAIRKWPSYDKNINKINFYRLTSSITLFSTIQAQFFDERFGVGADFGSNEDASYICDLLNKGYKGKYFHRLIVNHEDQPIHTISLEKIKSYSYGFGRFIREYFSWQNFFIFLLSLFFQTAKAIVALCKNNKLDYTSRFQSIKYRVFGFFRFK